MALSLTLTSPFFVIVGSKPKKVEAEFLPVSYIYEFRQYYAGRHNITTEFVACHSFKDGVHVSYGYEIRRGEWDRASITNYSGERTMEEAIEEEREREERLEEERRAEEARRVEEARARAKAKKARAKAKAMAKKAKVRDDGESDFDEDDE